MASTRPTLFVRLATGDTSAQTELFSIYHPFLVCLALRRHADVDADIASNIASDVLIEFINRQSRAPFVYDPSKGSFRGYLKTAVNNAVDAFIKNQNKVRLVDPVSLDFEPSVVDPVDRTVLLQTALADLRSQLDGHHLQVFDLMLQQLPSAEIARRLSLKPGRVYQVRHKLSVMIREIIKELGD